MKSDRGWCQCHCIPVAQVWFWRDGTEVLSGLYQVVGGRFDVPRRVLLRRLQRRAAAVAGGREAGGGLAREGPALLLAPAAPLGVLWREDGGGGLGGEVAAEEAVPARGRGGAGAVGRGRSGASAGGARARAVEGEGPGRGGGGERRWRRRRGFGEGEEGGEVRRRHGRRAEQQMNWKGGSGWCVVVSNISLLRLLFSVSFEGKKRPILELSPGQPAVGRKNGPSIYFRSLMLLTSYKD